MAKNKRGGNKKAIFFSLDALIALIIILMTIMVIYPVIRYSEKESAVPGDIINVLSELKIGEMNSVLVSGWIGNQINDTNKSVLEQIGDFYVNEETRSLAEELAREVLLTINTNENIGIWIEGDPDYVLIASRNTTSYEDAKTVNVERQIISGIRSGEETTGYSARAFLSNTEQTKYYYFGGYVGEGNITLNVEYNGSLKNVSLEIAASKNFTICINEHDCSGSFEPAVSEFEPKIFSLDAYILNFDEGKNNLTIVPKNGGIDFHIAGGYLKLTYSDGVQYEQPVRYYFPGIKGIINLYDGFYAPGDLNSLEVNIKAKVNDPAKKMYMKIGDVLIFNQSTDGIEKTIYNDSTQILSILTAAGKRYSDFSNKTIPIRIGIEGVDYLESGTNASVISVNGLSGAMSSIKGDTDRDGIIESSEKGISVLQYVNNELVDSVIDYVDFSSVGLSTTKSAVFSSGNSVLPTTRNKNQLHTVINAWNGNGNLDICPALEKAIEEFETKPIDDLKFMVNLIYKMPNSCNGKTSGEEIKQEIINILCQASIDHKILIYNIEVGLSESTSGERVAEAMVYTSSPDTCYGGKYYDGDTYLGGDLVKIYDEIVTIIKNLIYNMQVIDVIESADASSYLSPESYIEFDYQRTPVRPGIVLNFEKPFDDDYQGSFNIPPNSDIAETKVISYSGSRWTDNVTINGTSVYTLRDYGSNYVLLGDPYAINIPNSKVNVNPLENNIVRLTTGLSPTKGSYPGSEHNKIIYTVIKKMISYSPLSTYAKGCIWTVEFEGGDRLTMNLPSNYGGTDTCSYTSEDYDSPGPDDALKIAIYKLFQKLDDNPPYGVLDLKFEEHNLNVSSSVITGIPYPWETVIQVRKWW